MDLKLSELSFTKIVLFSAFYGAAVVLLAVIVLQLLGFEKPSFFSAVMGAFVAATVPIIIKEFSSLFRK